MQIRVIKQGTVEVVGAVQHDEAPIGNAYHWVIPATDGTPANNIMLAREWYITDWSGNPLRPSSYGVDEKEVTVRLERFYICPENLIGKVPGWVRTPPKRIMILGDRMNC